MRPASRAVFFPLDGANGSGRGCSSVSISIFYRQPGVSAIIFMICRDKPSSSFFWVTFETMNELSKSGRPTLLFSPNGRPLQDFPDSVRTYLKQGEQAGLPARPLIASRKPWYKMEKRQIPPFLFAYLGRRNARFIKNEAGVTPLTGFLCVYPNNSDPDYVEKLWRVLSDPETVANLSLVGKSYGSGCIKVEPRSLERLPIPSSVINRHGLNQSAVELALDWGSSADTNEAVLVREARAKYQPKRNHKPTFAGKACRR
jgi:hypothetical protein